MADTQMGEFVDAHFTNSLRATASAGGSDDAVIDPVDYTSITALRAQLSGYDAFTYTSAVLDSMTVNDMVFAVRSINDPTSIADYVTAQVARVS